MSRYFLWGIKLIGTPLPLLELLTLCTLVALVFERILSVVFKNEQLEKNVLKLPQTLPLIYGAHFAAFPRFPLRDSVTLAAAILASYALPIHLIETLIPQFKCGDIDLFVTALYITGIARLIQSIFNCIEHRAGRPSITPNNHLAFDAHPNRRESWPPRQFKLGRLQLAPIAKNKAADSR